MAENEDLRRFTLVMLETYRLAAKKQYEMAEEAILKAIALKEHASAMLDRAAELAEEYGIAEDTRGPSGPGDDIDW